MRKDRKMFALVLVLVMMLSSVTVNAEGNDCSSKFSDVDESHWAYEYICLMSDLSIINGYDDGSFKPSATVSRAEFAKMMVLTLNLELYYPSAATFLDVSKSDWEFPYVETGKFYLTGFKTTTGYNFKPDATAVREDMAVAIVKGLGLNPDSTDLTVLDGYSDEDSISPNLRKYVATAINEGIMIGSGGAFSPQGNLTRAEAATLLARLIVEEKVVFEEEEKVTFEEVQSEAGKTPTLEAALGGDSIILEWSEVPEAGFKYYKVAISSSNSSPRYQGEDCYSVPLSGVNNNRYVLESGMNHNGLVLKGGTKYYVAITAVYESEKLTSNVETVVIPGTYVEPDTSSRTPNLEYEIREEYDDVLLEWTQVPGDNFKYYKVVVSKYDSTPSYPDNGYAKYLSNPADTRWELTGGDGYSGGDLGGSIKGGETYYVAITAVYNDGKYTSNVKTITIPGDYSEPDITEKTPVLDAVVKDNGVKLQWTQTSSQGFSYYKVVLSKYNATPSYPNDGYLVYITDSSDTDYFVQELQSYHGGDFGGQVQDETYYMTVTACYGDGKYTSNTKVITVPSK